MALNAVSENKTIIKSALGFFSGTLLSRVSGFFRDISMAFFFGADASIAAFLVALRLAILLRRIFGEGALLNGFIPHFESHRTQDPSEAARFFRDAFFSLSILLLFLIGTAEVGLYFIAPHVQAKEILDLTMLILPGVPFVCLFGICSGLLHCEKYFFITGVAPVAYNAIWILAIWILGNQSPKIAASGLSMAISFAFFFQWLITTPKTISFLRAHLSWKEIFRFRFFSSEMRKMMSSLSLGVIGVTAVQINTAIDTIFSRYASLEGPAYLNYAIHLQQLPLALFGVGVASVLLPSLSRTLEAIDRSKLVEFAISRAMFVLIPCTAAIFVGGSVSVNLIYGRGHFGSQELLHTTQCLWGYGLGLVPMALTLLLSPIFYAKKDYKTPMICSLASIGVNLALNTLLVTILHWGPASLAYSTSLAAIVNVLLLGIKIPTKDICFSPALKQSLLSTTACALFAATITVGVAYLRDPVIFMFESAPIQWDRNFATQLRQFLTFFVSFVGSFFLAAVGLKKKEIFAFLTSKR